MASAQRVLMVHDDKQVARALGLLLEKDGVEILSTDDWDEAWEWVREGLADAVLMGVGEPGSEFAVGAVSFLQAIRKDKGLGNYPVGALCEGRKMGVGCLGAGVNVFWEMPVMGDEFVAGVKGLLEGRVREMSRVT